MRGFRFSSKKPKRPARSPAKPVVSKRLQRRLDKIEARKQDELTDIEIESRRLTLNKKIEGFKEERAERQESRKAQLAREARDRFVARMKAFRKRLAEDRPLLAALMVASLSFVAAIAGQFMFYTSLNWHGWGWIAFVLPFIVEGATWTFATFAQYLAAQPDPLPYGNYTRAMWLFAGSAAATNGYHIWITLGDPTTGIVLGAASIVGPIVWHGYITLTKLKRKGLSAAQIRAAILRWIFHPILSLRARSLWSAADATMTPALAWKITWMRAKGAAPGATPTSATMTFRNQWLFRLMFGRVLNPTIAITAATATEGATTPVTTSKEPRSEQAEVAPPQPQPVDEVAQPPAISDVGATGLFTDEELREALGEWAQLGAEAGGATDEPGATATLDRAQNLSSEPVAQPQPDPQPQPVDEVAQPPVQPQPQPPAQPRNQVAQPQGATATALELIKRFYEQERNRGVQPADVGPSLCLKFVRDGGRDVSRQYVSKKLAELREQELGSGSTATKGSDGAST